MAMISPNDSTPNDEINEAFEGEESSNSSLSHGDAPAHGISSAASIAAGDATGEHTEDLEYDEPNSPEGMIADADESI